MCFAFDTFDFFSQVPVDLYSLFAGSFQFQVAFQSTHKLFLYKLLLNFIFHSQECSEFVFKFLLRSDLDGSIFFAEVLLLFLRFAESSKYLLCFGLDAEDFFVQVSVGL